MWLSLTFIDDLINLSKKVITKVVRLLKVKGVENEFPKIKCRKISDITERD